THPDTVPPWCTNVLPSTTNPPDAVIVPPVCVMVWPPIRHSIVPVGATLTVPASVLAFALPLPLIHSFALAPTLTVPVAVTPSVVSETFRAPPNAPYSASRRPDTVSR